MLERELSDAANAERRAERRRRALPLLEDLGRLLGAAAIARRYAGLVGKAMEALLRASRKSLPERVKYVWSSPTTAAAWPRAASAPST